MADQPVPSLAAAVDYLLGRVKDAVRQAIVAQMQPQPLDWVELRRVRRQEHQAEVLGHAQLAGSVPPGFVHQHDAVRTWRHGLRQLGEKQVHRGGIETRHHQRNAGVACRAYRADDPGRLETDIAQPARGIAALPPDIAGAPLLSDPGLVLAPDLKPLGLGMGLSNLAQAGCKAPFLKACCAFSSVCG